MALYDWNKNEKKDIADDFSEYQIYKNCMKSHTENSGSGSGECGTWLIGFGKVVFVIDGGIVCRGINIGIQCGIIELNNTK